MLGRKTNPELAESMGSGGPGRRQYSKIKGIPFLALCFFVCFKRGGAPPPTKNENERKGKSEAFRELEKSMASREPGPLQNYRN